MQHIQHFEEIQPGFYKVDTHPNLSKLEIKNMVESMFQVKVLQINTLRKHRYKKSLIGHAKKAPQTWKRAYMKTEPTKWEYKK